MTAAIIEQDGRILICRRPIKEGKLYGGLWEFPGGKIERGESPKECLERELREELNINTEAGEVFDVRCDWGEKDILLIFMRVKIVSGTLSPNEHSEVRFVRPDELPEYEFCPSDTRVADKLAREGA